MGWADLMKPVFQRDVTACPCGGRLRIIAAILKRDLIEAHLQTVITGYHFNFLRQ